MSLSKNAFGFFLGSITLVATHAASLLPGLYGPSSYLSVADSPFSMLTGSPDFYLEDFEDTVFTPGFSTSAGSRFGPSGITDSVDADNGPIDGLGQSGASFFSLGGSTGIRFNFDEGVLGSLPIVAGIVWTDAGFGADLFFSAEDGDGNPLGDITVSNGADNSNSGTTAEDTFFGIVHPGGIGSIFVSNSSGGIEVDHLQYAIPEPAVAPWLSGLVALAMLRSYRSRVTRLHV